MTTALLEKPRPASPLRQPAWRPSRGLAGSFGAPLLLSLVVVALFWVPGANELLEYVDRKAPYLLRDNKGELAEHQLPHTYQPLHAC